MALPDVDLLQRIAAEDRAAFEEFYDRHSPRVFGFLLKLLGGRAEAEDVLQDTFWHVWSRAGQYEARRSSPIAWLVLVARSRATDYLRRHRKHETGRREFDPESNGDVAGLGSFVEDAESMGKALAQLPDGQRMAIHLAFFDGLTHEQIARRSSVPLGTVKTQIRRGMQTLRFVLNGARDGEPG